MDGEDNMPLTRDQKDTIWDIIPATFDIPTTEDTTDIVTFTKDTITEFMDVQVQTSFSQLPVKYPTIQIQYAAMDTRVNFMNFLLGKSKSPVSYFTNDPETSWLNVQGNEQIFILQKDDFDFTMQIDIKARMVATSTSRLVVELFEESGNNFIKIDRIDLYGPNFSQVGGFLTAFKGLSLDPTIMHKIRLRSLGDGSGFDLGIEVALDGSSDPIYEVHEAILYEDHGNVENVTCSIRIISDNKPTSRAPGVGKFIESEDIADAIVKQVETAFFKDFDNNMTDAELIKASDILDVTAAVASGNMENVTARQIDFLIANVNRLREQLTTPVDIIVNLSQDESSDTIS